MCCMNAYMEFDLSAYIEVSKCSHFDGGRRDGDARARDEERGVKLSKLQFLIQLFLLNPRK